MNCALSTKLTVTASPAESQVERRAGVLQSGFAEAGKPLESAAATQVAALRISSEGATTLDWCWMASAAWPGQVPPPAAAALPLTSTPSSPAPLTKTPQMFPERMSPSAFR